MLGDSDIKAALTAVAEKEFGAPVGTLLRLR
jgi:hypothetical protein